MYNHSAVCRLHWKAETRGIGVGRGGPGGEGGGGAGPPKI